MYGAVAARSRSWGVLMNALVAGGAASQPAAGFGPAQPGSGGGGGAPRSLLFRVPVPYGLVKVTCGTPVLGSRLSVNCGPPWHSMQPPLPWKSFSPRSAAGDSVPSSNDVAGGCSVLMEAGSAATRRPASASQAADAVVEQSPVTKSFMWPLTGRMTAAASVG